MVAMQALESLLEKCKKVRKPLDFDSLNHRICCYAYIINICSSHIIASVTSTSKSYLSDLKVPVDPNNVTCNDDNDDNESDDGYDYDDSPLIDNRINFTLNFNKVGIIGCSVLSLLDYPILKVS